MKSSTCKTCIFLNKKTCEWWKSPVDDSCNQGCMYHIERYNRKWQNIGESHATNIRR